MKYSAISNNSNPALFLTHDTQGAGIVRRTPQLFREHRPDGVQYEINKLAQATHDWHEEELFCFSASTAAVHRIVYAVLLECLGKQRADGLFLNDTLQNRAVGRLLRLFEELPCNPLDVCNLPWTDPPTPVPDNEHAPDGEVSPAHTAILGDDGRLDDSDQT